MIIRWSLMLACTLVVATPAVCMAQQQTPQQGSRIDSRVDSLRYNSNPSTLGPNDASSRTGLFSRQDSRVRSRVDSFNYNSNPSTFVIINPQQNRQRF